MFKKIGIPLFAVLAFMVLLAPAHANAGVRFSVGVGPAYYPPPYVYSYPYPYAYGYPYPSSYYYYSAPYRYPYHSGFYFRGGHDRRVFVERRGFRERGFRERDRDGRRFRR